jgi:putative glutamine amidotransferase
MQSQTTPSGGRPRIGIGCDVEEGPPPIACLKLEYIDAVAAAGGIPILLPPCEATFVESLKAVDGLLLSGGDDYDPSAYGQPPHPALDPMSSRRHRADLVLARTALDARFPVLGVCGGLQLLNIALGGDLIQDIADLVPGAVPHRGSRAQPLEHPVRIEPGTLLAALVGGGPLPVNTYHHQSVGRLGAGLRVSATAADGVVEAVEGEGASGGRFLLAVQWHPERDPRPPSRAIFEGLVEAARRWSRAPRP